MTHNPTPPVDPARFKATIGYNRCWNVHSSEEVSSALRDLSDANAANAAALKVLQDNATQTAADAQAAKARLDSIEADGIFDRSEKAQMIAEFGNETAQQTGLQNMPSNVDLTTEKANLASAYADWKAYLEGPAAYTDTSTNTQIDRATYNLKEQNYWLAKQTLANKAAGLGSTTATWGNVTGTGKPYDNADVTANNTSKDTAAVGGVPAATVVGAIKDSSGNVVGVQALKDATAAAASTAATARTEAAQVRTDLVPTISQAQSDATAAKNQAAQVRTDLTPTITAAQNDATKARTDLASEVTAARAAEGALSTRITTAQQTADGASTAITTETTQRTNADTALANRATTLESKTGSNGAINANPTFTLYTNAASAPDGWQYDNQFNGGASRVAGENGGYALQTIAAANTNCYSGQQLPTPIRAGTWWVIEADVQLNAGTFAGAGVLFRSGTDFLISFSTDLDTTQTVVGAGVVGQTYRFRKLIQTTTAVTTPVLYAMTHYSSFGALSATSTVTWFRCAVRPASGAEVLAQKADTTLNTPSTGIVARMGTEETTRANADTAIANRTTTLEGQVNNGTTGLAATYSRIGTEETTRANQDTALSNRVGSLESTVNTAGTGLSARMTTEENTRAAADSALATRATTLEATTNAAPSNSVNANPYFASWPNAGGTPSGWSNWGSAGTIQRTNSESGVTGTYGVQFSTTAAGQLGMAQALPLVAGWYVIEADVSCGSGSWTGSGVTIGGVYSISFAVDPDSNGTVTSTVLGRRKFSKLVNVAASDATNFHPMANWDGFGTFTAKTLVFYRCAFRQASDGEIKAQKADAALNTPSTGVIARLTTEETTRANADTAISNRTATLESTVNSGTSGVAATYARIGTEETTRANAVSALANRAYTLESRAGNSSNYTNPNASFTAWPDGGAIPAQWSFWNNRGTFTRETSGFTNGNYLLGHAVTDGNDAGLATTVYLTPGYWVMEGTVWCSSGTFAGSGMYVDNLALLNFSTVPDSNNTTGPSGPSVRNWSYMVQTAFTGNATLYLMTNWSSFGTTTAKTLRWLKCGIRPATDGEIKAQKADATLNNPGGIVARMGTEETTRANADTALANRASSLESAVNTPTYGLYARMGAEETTRANADTALSNRTTNLESTVNNGTSGVAATYARIGAEETTRANAVSAVANRTSTLETRAGNSTNFTNANPTFAAWPDGAAFPSQWSSWQSGTVSREATNFTSGAYAAYQNVPNADQGICTQFYVTAGYWVYEASVWCSTGTFQGAGLYADNLPGLNFSTVADINNVAGVGGPGVRNWSYLVQTTYTGQINLYAMGNWANFGTTSAKVIHWLKAGIRPASSAEVLALKADATLNNAGGIVARMGTEETTRANADSALANRASTLETNFTKLVANPNLLGPLNNWTGPASFYTSSSWGPIIQWGGTQGDFEFAVASSPAIGLSPNVTYTLSCDLLAVGNAATYATMDVVCYDANNNLVYDGPNTNAITNADYSDYRGIGGVAVTFTTPSTATYGYVRLLGNAKSGNVAYIGARKVKLERGNIATAYNESTAVTTTNAAIKDEATTRSNGDSALANRATSLESNYSSVRNDLNNWNNDRYNQSVAVNSRVANEETARANADGALASRTNTLEASVSTGGNLLTSSNFNSGSAGWGAAYTNSSFTAVINAAGDDWHPTNESALSFNQNNTDGSQYGYWYSDLIPVNQGQWYQVSCYVASHRADSGIGYEFWNYNGSTITASTQPVRISRGTGINGGKDLNGWDRVCFNVQASGPLMKAQLWKWGTNAGNGVSDSYAWFVRPQVCAVANGNAPYVPYAPASGSAQLGNLSASVTQSQAAIANLNGRAAAYWQVQTVAGNNRAQLTVRADANGGAGVDIVGDVNFSGNLNIGADSGGNRTKITNQNYQVFDGNGVRRVALGLGF